MPETMSNYTIYDDGKSVIRPALVNDASPKDRMAIPSMIKEANSILLEVINTVDGMKNFVDAKPIPFEHPKDPECLWDAIAENLCKVHHLKQTVNALRISLSE